MKNHNRASVVLIAVAIAAAVFGIANSLIAAPAVAAASAASVQGHTASMSNASMHAWTGVWQVKETDKPGVTITLADDSGALAGTIVFDVWQRQTDKHLATEPRTLVNPHLNGNTLTFQVRRILKPHLDGESQAETDAPDPTDIVEMTLVSTADGKATLNCAKCGGNAPTELVREP